MSSQNEARKNRAASRARRRDAATPESVAGQEPTDDSAPDEGEQLKSVKQAAKVAAVGAAVGAATAAARAFAHERDAAGDDAEPDQATDDAEDDEVSDAAYAEPDPPPESGEDPQQSPPEPRPDQRLSPENGEGEHVAGAALDEVSTAVDKAREQLQALLGHDVEGVSGLQRTQDGWRITFEVVEFARVPESTDLLASYEVDLDDSHGLRSYARLGRYTRAQADSGG